MMLQYRSYADLRAAVMAGLCRLPRDIDLVAAIPRSGLLPATIIALAINRPLTDIAGLLEGRSFESGLTGRIDPAPLRVADCRRILVVDDSIDTGTSMRQARERLLAAGIEAERITCLAVYARPRRTKAVDIALEICSMPRLFEWNVLHHGLLSECCLDIDGILCRDPEKAENDDGPAYRRFLEETEPFLIPTKEVGCLVTCRLEKYRRETEAWLARHSISYRQLMMLDLPDGQTRRRLRPHAAFKAKVYQERRAMLFIESDSAQAREIARLSGRPVLDMEQQVLLEPELLSLPGIEVRVEERVRWFRGRARGLARRLNLVS